MAELADASSVFHKEVRGMSTDFQLALDSMFLENESIAPLTRKYAIF